MRNSHEEIQRHSASDEMKMLHEKIKRIFTILSNAIASAFHKKQRYTLYSSLLKKLKFIINTTYRNNDAKRIQKSIENQAGNLLTALLHKNVPLTNNLAERSIRPLVVMRKISGGSKSLKAAQTHMINMSIFQTIRMQNPPLLSTLKQLLLTFIFGKE